MSLEETVRSVDEGAGSAGQRRSARAVIFTVMGDAPIFTSLRSSR